MRRALSNATAYSALQALLGAGGVHRHLVGEHLRPAPSERLLDLGCGPGDVLEALPEVDYVGVDASPRYLDAARRRWGDRAEFRLADARAVELEPGERFDAVLSIGLLHHLDDPGVRRVADVAASAMRSGGRLVTLDPGLADGQPRIARMLVERDRGHHLRRPDEYRELLAARFDSVRATVRHDLARLPYTHVILECRDPRATAGG